MDAMVFIGDELTAAGFRLTGIDVIVPAAGEVAAAFADATRRAGLVIITADLARQVAPGDLDAATTAEASTVAIIPDVLFRVSPPDLARRLRGILGIEN